MVPAKYSPTPSLLQARSLIGSNACHAGSALEAKAALLALAPELDRTHSGAAPACAKASTRHSACCVSACRRRWPHLEPTNCIESIISVCREHAGNVKRWRDEQIALRWCAAGMVEAGKQFRRFNGHLHPPALRAALERHITENVTPIMHTDQVSAA